MYFVITLFKSDKLLKLNIKISQFLEAIKLNNNNKIFNLHIYGYSITNTNYIKYP